MLTCEMKLLVVVISLALPWVGERSWAADVSTKTVSEMTNLAFGVFWPPQAASEISPPGARPLLNGTLVVHLERVPESNVVARLRIILSRSSDEAGREFWNSRLAFPEYDWMRYVRVWDAGNQWLWPNLPYLLRLHGTERVERYGGVDPGKGVDNDFAAVLIRKYDARGTNESVDTRRAPLVAAEWYSAGVTPVDKQTIVHVAQSEEFTLHLGRAEEDAQELAAVWLVYADFMGAKLPPIWPQTLEFAGGILACFEMGWDLKAKHGHEISVRQVVPKQGTGFDWERWSLRAKAAQDPKSAGKLSDLVSNRAGGSKSSQATEGESSGPANGSRR